MKLETTKGYEVINRWLTKKGFSAFEYQLETWQHIINKKSGLVNAPTGCGKTFSVFLGSVINFINGHPTSYKTKSKNNLQLLWVTPLRALATDIGRAMEEVIYELGMNWKVGIRNGDTSIAERQKQKRQVPEVLIITPESLHLLLAQKNYPDVFNSLKIIAVDEWHELIGSKRGVQVELALSRIIHLQYKKQHQISVWGISATIGNLEEAKEVLLSPRSFAIRNDDNSESVTVTANIQKPILIESVFPDEIEKFPWAGHLG
ncbi:MAG: DEAD/DEAH box helicase, partial [Ginsengibacter sp.]